MITAISIILTLHIVFTLTLALALGNVLNRCKKYEELLTSLTSNQLHIALNVAKLTQEHQGVAGEMEHFVRKGEVN